MSLGGSRARSIIKPPRDVDDYISRFPAEVQKILERIRETIRQAVPGAEEKISYGIPAYHLKCDLVYFAAFKKHIGFYPTSSGVRNFTKELSGFETSKGTVRFPLEQLIPLKLIARIAKFRAEENKSR